MEGWGPGVVGVVFSDETNDHTGPETEHDTSESFPSVHGEWNFLGTTNESEVIWENENWDNDASSLENSGDTNLEFKSSLDVLDLNGSEVDQENGSP